MSQIERSRSPVGRRPRTLEARSPSARRRPTGRRLAASALQVLRAA